MVLGGEGDVECGFELFNLCAGIDIKVMFIDFLNIWLCSNIMFVFNVTDDFF